MCDYGELDKFDDIMASAGHVVQYDKADEPHHYENETEGSQQ